MEACGIVPHTGKEEKERQVIFMRTFFEKAAEAIKFIFDLVRAVLYFITWIMRIAVIGTGLFGAAFMIYEVCQLFQFFNAKTNSIPLAILIILFVLVPISWIAELWYYIVLLAYYLVAGMGIPLDWNNDVLVEISYFFDDILYRLVPSLREEQVQMLGFENMKEFEEFTEYNTRVNYMFSKADIEEFRKNHNTNY